MLEIPREIYLFNSHGRDARGRSGDHHTAAPAIIIRSVLSFINFLTGEHMTIAVVRLLRTEERTNVSTDIIHNRFLFLVVVILSQNHRGRQLTPGSPWRPSKRKGFVKVLRRAGLIPQRRAPLNHPGKCTPSSMRTPVMSVIAALLIPGTCSEAIPT